LIAIRAGRSCSTKRPNGWGAILDPSLIVGLEHFGSTAIPALSAKPIVDILIAVRSLADARSSFVEALRTLDYVYWADNPRQDRLFFVKGMPRFGPRRSLPAPAS
jgi:GrpB-like predicted nucleotidyltransferase (UPF0157 family)